MSSHKLKFSEWLSAEREKHKMDDYFWRRTKGDKTEWQVFVNVTLVPAIGPPEPFSVHEFSLRGTQFVLEHLNIAPNVSELYNAMLHDLRQHLWRRWNKEEFETGLDDNTDSAPIPGK